MAKARTSKRKAEESIYTCINPCTIAVGHDINGNVVHKLYRTAGEVDISEVQLAEGGMDGNDCVLKVAKGTVVPHHFAPENDSAYDDREDQLANPLEYINGDEMNLLIIAELMVDEGWFRDKMKEDEKGKMKIEKLAAAVAADSIKEQMGADEAAMLTDTEDKERIKLLNKLISLGDDDKDTKKQLIAMLKDAGVKMFWGAEIGALADRVLEEGLYEG